ncbi:MAG: fluoride efflux transporter CrcB [Myxococcales bacterium]|nr:fluoride efflux transporter CrcB [Myxococcales bacterium]MCH7866687.1 fluoride efflux transporter CrcB [Myxococcales bacterium]
MKWLVLAVGGGIGASLRYALSIWVDQRIASTFPWGTLSVNFVGSFLLGLLISWLDQRGLTSPDLRLFLITGMLGAFTTFSTFSMETLRLIESGRLPLAAANMAGSVGVCLLAVVAGVALARSLG